MGRRLLLIAGASGSGKSRLARLACQTGRAVAFRLDDFYRDADAPGLPMTDLGIPDWDHPATWDCAQAVDAMARLLVDATVEVPSYDISLSRRVGTRTVELGEAELVIAEGIFAVQALAAARAAGVAAEGWWLDRPRAANFARRLTRDLRQRRKTPWVLLRRGAALLRAEPALKRAALQAGFRPVAMRAALAELGTAPGRGTTGVTRSRRPRRRIRRPR